MKQAAQVELMKTMLEMVDNGTSVDAGRMVKAPTSSYTDKDLAEREWETMFQNHPQIVGISPDLPNPGSFITNSDLGIPIIATRDKDGKFHAFVNACRHRGALLTEEERGEKKRFICPFHAWTYTTDGRLMGIRESQLFGDVDKACYGLVELPSQEKYGLLVVHPQVDGSVDIDELLGADLAEQLEAWDVTKADYLGDCGPLHGEMNWKLANDTFGENYHFHTLHGTQLNNMYYGDASGYDEYGRHHRLSILSRYVDVMRQRPEKDWNVSDAGIIVYYLFPNVQLVFFNRVITLVRVYPKRGEVGRSLTRISNYSAQHIGAENIEEGVKRKADELYDADMSQRVEFTLETQIELMRSTLENEDYHTAAQSQLAADSGRVEHFIFGRNEPALHHFHTQYRDALGMPPLEEYCAEDTQTKVA